MTRRAIRSPTVVSSSILRWRISSLSRWISRSLTVKDNHEIEMPMDSPRQIPDMIPKKLFIPSFWWVGVLVSRRACQGGSLLRSGIDSGCSPAISSRNSRSGSWSRHLPQTEPDRTGGRVPVQSFVFANYSWFYYLVYATPCRVVKFSIFRLSALMTTSSMESAAKSTF